MSESASPAPPVEDVKPTEETPQVNGETPAAATESPEQGETAKPAQPASTPTNAQAASNNATSLYVGELDNTVTEAMLYEIFSMIGAVSSIRVCRDAVTRRSLGYAYVNYLNGADAERALDSLNYSEIKGKACRIMLSQRDPALRKTGTGNIFLKNLDENIDNKALHDTFAAFGDILSCKVQLDEAGNSKGYGFVHFTTADAADAAIIGVNGMLLNDKVVFVGHHVPKRERQAKIDEVRSRFTNIYVKNLPLDMEDDGLNKLFVKFGTITSAVMQKGDDGKPKGFGFINFEDHQAAQKAVDELHESEYQGQTLFVGRAQKKGEREEELRKAYTAARNEKNVKYQGVNLFVKNLDDDMDDEKLNAEFTPYGTITSARVMRDDKGTTKGFGFVCFSAPDEATKAVGELNGKMIGNKPLYVALAQPKEVRQQQLAAQSAQRDQMRNQQLAAAGIPQMGYGMPPAGAPMFYQNQSFGPPGGRGMPPMMAGGFPQQRMMQNPRYAPQGQMYPGGYPQQGPYGYPQQGRGMPMPQTALPGAPGPRGYPPQQPMRGNMPQPGQPPMGMPMPMAARNPAGQQQGPPPANGVAPAARQAPYSGKSAQPQKASAPSGPSIDPSILSAASNADQKQMLGEALYPRIHENVPALAGKITGMLLEMDNAELLHLLEDESALTAKVNEAVQVLEEYSKAEAGEAGEA